MMRYTLDRSSYSTDWNVTDSATGTLYHLKMLSNDPKFKVNDKKKRKRSESDAKKKQRLVEDMERLSADGNFVELK